MADDLTKKWADLRKPFDSKVVGKIPKGGVQLDYVGHAAVTDRLLSVDPTWSWEPLATDDRGLPLLDSKGNLWIKLTVLGVTRIGVGDGKNAKEVIGDALRNAAMRFGVALDLWTKDELESHLDEPESKNPKPSARPAVDGPTEAQSKTISGLLNQLLPGDENKPNRDKVRLQATTKAQATKLIDQLMQKLEVKNAEPVYEPDDLPSKEELDSLFPDNPEAEKLLTDDDRAKMRAELAEKIELCQFDARKRAAFGRRAFGKAVFVFNTLTDEQLTAGINLADKVLNAEVELA